MNSEPKVIVHGGIEKAASTFLQKVVFPSLKNVSYRADLISDLSKIGSRHHSQFDQELAGRLENLVDTSTIVSNEGLLCPKWVHGSGIDREPMLSLLNLKSILGECLRVFIVIRRQDSAINSMIRYKQRWLSDPDLFLVDYPVRKSRLGGELKLSSLSGRLLNSYNYYRMLSSTIEIIGRKNVTVLVYEDLVNDPDFFFQTLGDFVGEKISQNLFQTTERVNSTSEKYEKLPNDYVPMGNFLRRANNLSGYRLEKILPKRKKAISDSASIEIRNIFREDNRFMAELFQLDIEKYGYY